jgi:hypothetical protein
MTPLRRTHAVAAARVDLRLPFDWQTCCADATRIKVFSHIERTDQKPREEYRV